mmetsp:Transcript_8579/g.11268  ORF Transcript_8579/g.11268 Transcript_8579/m.11268 type:complete len:440 (-) Transcript_8579:6-1325(-)
MASEIIKIGKLLRSACLMETPYVQELGLFCFSLSNALRARGALGDAFWMHSLVFFFLTTFGGSTVVGIVLGGPPGFLTNDKTVVVASLAWYLANYCPGDLFKKASAAPVSKELIVFFKETFRANGCVSTVIKANQYFAATKYYPTPIYGPIMCGILGSNAGGFFPPSRGLATIEKGVSWNIQCAGFCGALYQFLVNDSFVIGSILRGLMFGGNPQPQTVRLICIFVFTSVALVQSHLGPHFNPFTPIHKVLYKVTNIPKQEEARERAMSADIYVGRPFSSRRKLESLYDLLKTVFVFAGLGLYVYLQHPHNVMHVGDSLHPGEFLSSCTFLNSFRKCDPFIMTLHSNGVLAVYQTTSPKKINNTQPLWSSPVPKNALTEFDQCIAQLKTDGTLSILKNDTGKVWSSPKPIHMGLNYEVRLESSGTVGVYSDSSCIWRSH